LFVLQASSPFGSRENLKSPQSPNQPEFTDTTQKSGIFLNILNQKIFNNFLFFSMYTFIQIFNLSVTYKDVRKTVRLPAELPQVHLDTPQGSSTADTGQSTTDMFLDMFTKKGKFLSKLTSFDSEVKNISYYSK